MAIHVEQVSTDVTVLAGDLPLTEAQLERLVNVIAARLERRRRDAERRRLGMMLRPSAIPTPGRSADRGC